MDYFDFINGKELYHHGVQGMKWGHHKMKEPYKLEEKPHNMEFDSKSKPGLAKRLAISTDKCVESMVRHTPIIGKKIVTNKEVDNNTRAKRGYAILGAAMATVGGFALKKVISDKKTKAGQEVVEQLAIPQKKPVNPELLKKFEEIQKPTNKQGGF